MAEAPQAPGWIDKVNYIIDFWEDPCHAPWTVYVQTALPALGSMYIQLIEGDVADFVRAAAKPKIPGAGRSSRHTRRGRRGGKGGGGLTNPVERAGQKIRGDFPLRGDTAQGGVKHLWQVDGAIQRGLWYWLVADIAADGFYNWMSLVQQSEYCSKKDSYAVSWGPTDQSILGLIGWHGLLLGEPDIQEPDQGFGAAPGSCRNFFRPWGMAIWATCYNWNQFPVIGQLGLKLNPSPNEGIDFEGPASAIGPLSFGSLFVKGSAPADTGLIMYNRTLGGNLSLLNARAAAG